MEENLRRMEPWLRHCAHPSSFVSCREVLIVLNFYQSKGQRVVKGMCILQLLLISTSFHTYALNLFVFQPKFFNASKVSLLVMRYYLFTFTFSKGFLSRVLLCWVFHELLCFLPLMIGRPFSFAFCFCLNLQYYVLYICVCV